MYAGMQRQFTTDRRLMHSAVDELRWTALSRRGVEPFESIEGTGLTNVGGGPGSGGTIDLAGGAKLSDVKEIVSALATLSAANLTVRAMASLPGRKAIVLVTEGIKMYEGRIHRAPDSSGARRALGSGRPRGRRHLHHRSPWPADGHADRVRQHVEARERQRCARRLGRAAQRAPRDAGLAGYHRPGDRRLRGDGHQRPRARPAADRQRHPRVLHDRLHARPRELREEGRDGSGPQDLGEGEAPRDEGAHAPALHRPAGVRHANDRRRPRSTRCSRRRCRRLRRRRCR